MTNILDYVYEKTGICFVEKKDIVLHKIDDFAKNKEFFNPDYFLNEIKRNDELWQDFINFLTINETYFFRENRQLDLLIEFALERSSFDILCLPCSSGEEAYSVAMMLDMAGLNHRLNKITAIDINSSVIGKAKSGVYSKKSFYKTDESIKDRYFSQSDENFIIHESMRAKCQFQTLNIFDSHTLNLGKFDFVLSRNMLIYFDTESKNRAVAIFEKLLKPDGVIFLGHADIISDENQLQKNISNGTVYYRLG